MDDELASLSLYNLPQVYPLGENDKWKPTSNAFMGEFSYVNLIGSIFQTVMRFAHIELKREEDSLRKRKKRLTKLLKDYEKQTTLKNKKSISIINNALLSIKSQIPSTISSDEGEIVERIKASSEMIQRAVTSIDSTIHDTLSGLKEQIDIEYKTKETKILESFDPEYFGLPQSPVWINCATESSKWLQKHTGSYFDGQATDKTDNGNSIKEFSLILSERFKSIETSLNQVVKNMEKIQITQEIIKNKQNKLEESIKKRNEADMPKRIQRKTCVTIIENILKQQYNFDNINSDSIEKMLYRWDKALERGEKIPVGGYDSARNNKIGYFSDWVKVTFIPFYIEKHMKKGNRRRFSSNNAAFDEAARKRYKDMRYQDEDEDEDDYD